MSKNNDKKDDSFYFLFFCGMGIVFGIIFHQLAIGLCLGMTIGLELDNKKKK